MEFLLYHLTRALLKMLQAMPLERVARLGRAGGAFAYWLDGRHRHVALRNLTMCFGREKSPAEIRALAMENFRRIGENFACAAKTASMNLEQLLPHVKFGPAATIHEAGGARPAGVVVAIGHFGNFELYARAGQVLPGYQFSTTYRGLQQDSLNRLLLSLRERSGCLFFDRRTEAAALKAAMNQGGLVLGLLSDQHGGRTGLRMPFLGHECSTSTAPAIFALRYKCPLYTGFCFRTGLAQWRLELGAEIATRENGVARSLEAIMRDVNQAFESAVLRDPANWFWVHNRWKAAGKGQGPKAEIRKPKPEGEEKEEEAKLPTRVEKV